MDTQICNRCQKEKAVSEFNWRYKLMGIRQPTCRDCQNKQKAGWYEKNRETHKANTRTNKLNNRAVAQAYIWDYLACHPCVDCGEPDPVVLEFDHVRGRKKDTVTNMAQHGYSIEAIQKEIAKCVVRCSNCHRRKTYRERGGFRG